MHDRATPVSVVIESGTTESGDASERRHSSPVMTITAAPGISAKTLRAINICAKLAADQAFGPSDALHCGSCGGGCDCWVCEGSDPFCTTCDGTNLCPQCGGEGHEPNGSLL